MDNEIQDKAAPLHTWRNIFIGLILIALVGGGFFAFFNKGLYLLPGKVCDGSVDRDVAIRTLPLARAADHRAGGYGEGPDFEYFCGVSTSGGSRMDGRVVVRDVSEATWVNDYAPRAGRRVVRTSKDGIEGLAQFRDDASDSIASVYVPCTPPHDPYDLDGKLDTRPHTYALMTEAGVSGETKATGADLRQDLTDFAYQITRHAYKMAKCKEVRRFPEQLPRYKSKSG